MTLAQRGEVKRAGAVLDEAFALRPQLFGFEALKVRGETLRFGATAREAAALDALYARGRRLAKQAPSP